jgi:hypothetical protein
MSRFRCWLGTLVLASIAWPACAVPVLSIERVNATVGVGGVATFELHASNLTDPLGAFAVDISFDPALLAFVPEASAGAQFGQLLGQPDSEAIGLALLLAPGVLHLDQVSLLDSASLDALQRDSGGQMLGDIVLAMFSLQGLGVGVSQIGFVPAGIVLADAAGNVLAEVLGVPSALAVVSEPATLWLLAFGVGVAAVQRRSRAWVLALRRWRGRPMAGRPLVRRLVAPNA